MSKLSDFIDHRLEGHHVVWTAEKDFWRLSVPKQKQDALLTQAGGCMAMVLGWMWLIPVAVFFWLYSRWRRYRLSGRVHISSERLINFGSQLFQGLSVEFQSTDCLVLEPRQCTVSGLRGSEICTHYRLTVAPLESLGTGEATTGEIWHERVLALQKQIPSVASLDGDLRQGERWIQSFLQLEMALSVAGKVSELSGRPFIDCTRDKEALIDTVKAAPYSLETVGSISLASSDVEGGVSLFGESLDDDPSHAIAPSHTAPLQPPDRVKVVRKDGAADIRMRFWDIPRLVRGSATGFAFVFGLSTGLTLVGSLWGLIKDGHTVLGLFLVCLLLLLARYLPKLYVDTRDRLFRAVWLRLDPDKVEVLNSLDTPEDKQVAWTEVYGIRVNPGSDHSTVYLRTATNLVKVVVPSDSAVWLGQELQSWCERAAWKKRQAEREEHRKSTN